MVPIYESDVAEKRWSEAEWEHYELWEKVERRLRRKKLLWILATAAVFVGLSSVPVVMARGPRWRALAASRRLAQRIGLIERRAALEHVAYRIRFDGGGSLAYEIETAPACDSAQFSRVTSGVLASGGMELLNPARARALDIPGAVEEFCYDPLRGSDLYSRGQSPAAFVILPDPPPVTDLTAPNARRSEQAALVLLTGESAEISFE